MYKNHIKCLYLGRHPYEEVLKSYLISKGYVFVDTEVDADIVILGGDSLDRSEIRNRPCIVLSSYEMFKGTDLSGPVKEEDIATLHPYMDFAEPALLHLLTERDTLAEKPTNSLVVRTFPIYGEGTPENLVSRLLKKASEAGPLEQLAYGFRIRSYLHVDDFCEGFERLLHRCLKGSAGIYNLGSTYQISVQLLAQSIWQLNGFDHKNMVEEEWVQRPWRPSVLVPDMTRTFALTQWRPQIALRMGLSNLIKNIVVEPSKELTL